MLLLNVDNSFFGEVISPILTVLALVIIVGWAVYIEKSDDREIARLEKEKRAALRAIEDKKRAEIEAKRKAEMEAEWEHQKKVLERFKRGESVSGKDAAFILKNSGTYKPKY